MNLAAVLAAARCAAADVVDLLYPRTCLACDELLEQDDPLCDACRPTVIRIGRRGCRQCGAEPLKHAPHRPSRCRRCARRRFAFRRAVAALRYGGAVQAGIVQLKFRGRREVATWLGRHVAEVVQEAGLAGRAQVVTAVPLHPFRRMLRGFDQSTLLAAQVAAAIDRPLITGVIRRRRHTSPQTLVPAALRRSNPAQAFVPGWRGRAVRGRRVLLIDDVMSTGSTLHEAACALLQAGAISVDAAVAAT